MKNVAPCCVWLGFSPDTLSVAFTLLLSGNETRDAQLWPWRVCVNPCRAKADDSEFFGTTDQPKLMNASVLAGLIWQPQSACRCIHVFMDLHSIFDVCVLEPSHGWRLMSSAEQHGVFSSLLSATILWVNPHFVSSVSFSLSSGCVYTITPYIFSFQKYWHRMGFQSNYQTLQQIPGHHAVTDLDLCVDSDPEKHGI